MSTVESNGMSSDIDYRSRDKFYRYHWRRSGERKRFFVFTILSILAVLTAWRTGVYSYFRYARINGLDTSSSDNSGLVNSANTGLITTFTGMWIFFGLLVLTYSYHNHFQKAAFDRIELERQQVVIREAESEVVSGSTEFAKL